MNAWLMSTLARSSSILKRLVPRAAAAPANPLAWPRARRSGPRDTFSQGTVSATGLPSLSSRPAKTGCQKIPCGTPGWRRAAFPLAVALDHRHDLAAVVDIGELLTRKPLVSLGGERLSRVGKLGEPLLSMIEEVKDALVVVEHEDPVEHFSRGVDDTDSLGKDLRAFDLAIEPAFVVVGRVVDQSGLEGHGHEIGVHTANDVGVGEYHLTGECGIPSAALVVNRTVDEDPEQARLGFWLRPRGAPSSKQLFQSISRQATFGAFRAWISACKASRVTGFFSATGTPPSAASLSAREAGEHQRSCANSQSLHSSLSFRDRVALS